MDKISKNILKNQVCILSEILTLTDGLIITPDASPLPHLRGFNFLKDRYSQTIKLLCEPEKNIIAATMLESQIFILIKLYKLRSGVMRYKVFPPQRQSRLLASRIEKVRELLKGE